MATAILTHAIQRAGGNLSWNLPHRPVDGYGLREKHVDAAHGGGARLIITADCGVRSHDAMRYAKSRGMTSSSPTTICQIRISRRPLP
ncbi:MAG TPA: hypothetical protein VFB14_28855 [Bryobacteraceae bacterium]|jgi:single-stranded-DNA-specific exonuclease|nr:hypothetical protein [Bryobacteraceae bacterium]